MAAPPPLGRAARLAGTAGLFLAACGCLVNSEEFDQARSLKESLRAEVSRLRQDNDQLSHEINRLYSDREILSGHVAMTAAVALHNRLTGGVRPAPPAAAPARPTPPRAAPAARPAGGGARGGASPTPAAPGGTAVDTPLPSVDGGRPSGAVDWGQ
jgi:outer membrane murein-binding lipoprotein Lpp